MKRLTEHLWMLIGMAAACQSIPELRQKMAERFGRQQVQFTLFVDPPSRERRALPRSSTNGNGQVENQAVLDFLARETED